MKYITSKHLAYLKNILENKHEFSYEELYYKPKYCTKWHKGRYAILQQGTRFFNNLVSIIKTIFSCETEEEWYIKLDLLRIQQEVVDFAISYFWMCPKRWFSVDLRCLNADILSFKYLDLKTSPIYDINAWQIVNNRFMKIAKEHLPICDVNYFINYKIDL